MNFISTLPPSLAQHSSVKTGFTLLELSIVLIIIGVIVGGVFVGADIIRSAGVRSQISQIEKYNSAANTFKEKYNSLPGDLDNLSAASFGFSSRPGTPGQGDGNGMIEGLYYANTAVASGFGGNCEPLFFWQDLTVGNPTTPLNINLIEGSFNTVNTANCGAAGAGTYPNGTNIGANMNLFLPAAKLGLGNYVIVFSTQRVNYFAINKITGIGLASSGVYYGSNGLTVQQAYQIDKKMDDGFPTTGKVQAIAIGGCCFSENQSVAFAITPQIFSPHSAIPPAKTDCFDSGGANYAITVNGGTGINCGLSFEFQ